MPVDVLTEDFPGTPALEGLLDAAIQIRITAEIQILPFSHVSKVAAIAVATRSPHL